MYNKYKTTQNCCFVKIEGREKLLCTCLSKPPQEITSLVSIIQCVIRKDVVESLIRKGIIQRPDIPQEVSR